MDEITPWLTPALIIGLFTWLQRDMRELRREMNERFKDINKRVTDEIKTLTDDMHQRFDQVARELGENRERMAKLEGALEGAWPADETGTQLDAHPLRDNADRHRPTEVRDGRRARKPRPYTPCKPGLAARFGNPLEAACRTRQSRRPEPKPP